MKKYLLLISLVIVPNLVFASSGNEIVSIKFALLIEAFVSIHMSVFVLQPLSNMLFPNNSKKMFWILFTIRAVTLLFFDFFITTNIALIDFMSVFIGIFLVLIISSIIKKDPYSTKTSFNIDGNSINNNQINSLQEILLNCTKCGSVLKVTDESCPKCGTLFDGNNVTVSTQQKIIVSASDFDPIFNNSEYKLLEDFINRELEKAGIDGSNILIPEDVLKRKNILNIIFSILVFIYISLIFFHFQ